MHSFQRLLLGTLILGTHYPSSYGQNDMTTDKPYSAEPTIPAEMKITSWNDMPFSGVVEENGTWVGKGYAFYLLELLSSKLNFTYTIIPPKQHILGNKQKGILSLLYQKKVDMAAAFLPILPELQQYCTFSIILDQAEITALMKRPHESAIGSGLLAPFDQTVWLLVLMSVLSMGPIIYIFAKLRAKMFRDPNSENYNVFSYTWFAYSSLLKQGSTVIATTDSTRILFATWWIFILILTSFYTANLTAFLTRSQFTLPISSLNDIVQKGYQWIAHKGRTIEYMISQLHPDELIPLNTTIYRGRYFTSYEYPVRTIFNAVDKNQLFLAENHYLQTLIFQNYVNKTRLHLEQQKKCTYVIMPGNIFVKSKAFAFPLGSSLEKIINKELLTLVEAGIVKQAKMKDLPLAEVCPVDLRSTDRQLSNNDLSLTYEVVIVGYAIALVVFIIEVATLWSKCSPKQQITTDKRTESINNKLSHKPKGIESKIVTPELVYTLKNRQLDSRKNLKKANSKPLYQNVPYNLVSGKKHCINGRDYYVVIDRGGDQRLIPIRTPSAFLFQYAVR